MRKLQVAIANLLTISWQQLNLAFSLVKLIVFVTATLVLLRRTVKVNSQP